MQRLDVVLIYSHIAYCPGTPLVHTFAWPTALTRRPHSSYVVDGRDLLGIVGSSSFTAAKLQTFVWDLAATPTVQDKQMRFADVFGITRPPMAFQVVFKHLVIILGYLEFFEVSLRGF